MDLPKGTTCASFCTTLSAKLKCVRSWRSSVEKKADYGKNECKNKYDDDQKVVCVCANLGTCKLFADCDKPEPLLEGRSIDKATAKQKKKKSTFFMIDKRTYG